MTRLSLLVLALFAALACTQESYAQDKSRHQTTYVYDSSGNRSSVGTVGQVASDGKTSVTERLQTLNGRTVPVETVEENVTSESDGTKVIERLIRRFDQTGNPLPPEKIRIEQRGSESNMVSVASVYRADLNGRFELAERSTTESSRSGDVVKSTTTVERSSGGSLETAERRDSVETKRAEGSAKDVVTLRKDPSGRFYDAAREITETVRQGDQVTSTVTQYNAANSGQLEFAGQTVTDIQKNSDGSETKVVNIYGTVAPGRTISQADSQQAYLREQQVTETRKQADGSTVNIFGVRRVSLNDNKLGEYHRISEVVCKGNCETGEGSAPPPPRP